MAPWLVGVLRFGGGGGGSRFPFRCPPLLSAGPPYVFVLPSSFRVVARGDHPRFACRGFGGACSTSLSRFFLPSVRDLAALGVVASALQSLGRLGDWLASFVLREVFLQIPVHPVSRLFLRIMASGQVCQFQALGFGLSTAPQVFPPVLAPVSAVLLLLGVRGHCWLAQSSSPEAILSDLQAVLVLGRVLDLVVTPRNTTSFPLRLSCFLRWSSLPGLLWFLSRQFAFPGSCLLLVFSALRLYLALSAGGVFPSWLLVSVGGLRIRSLPLCLRRSWDREGGSCPLCHGPWTDFDVSSGCSSCLVSLRGCLSAWCLRTLVLACHLGHRVGCESASACGHDVGYPPFRWDWFPAFGMGSPFSGSYVHGSFPHLLGTKALPTHLCIPSGCSPFGSSVSFDALAPDYGLHRWLFLPEVATLFRVAWLSSYVLLRVGGPSCCCGLLPCPASRFAFRQGPVFSWPHLLLQYESLVVALLSCGCTPSFCLATTIVPCRLSFAVQLALVVLLSCGFSSPLWFITFAMGSPLRGRG